MLFVSFYFFPIQFTFFPEMNTKMAMAAVGVCLFVLETIKTRSIVIEKDTLFALMSAAMVSLAGFISVTYNHTQDYSYASYIVSMLVWMGGAYTAVWAVRKVEGQCSCVLVCNYLIAVCVFQCVSAIFIDMVPVVRTFVDSWLYGFGFTDLANIKSIRRMYGIGAVLDVAGSRFAVCLVIIACLLRRRSSFLGSKVTIIYILSFFIVAVIGNMIGRTTTLGLIISVVFWLMTSSSLMARIRKDYLKIICWFGVILSASVLLTVYLYNHNRDVRENLRFAFEGFFSYAETGEWHTTSGDRLETMYVWPDNSKTWIIGDGYFEGAALDPNFIGKSGMTNYYMWTDVGYCRFIFYFGVVGLLTFSFFFLLCGKICVTKFSRYRIMFILIVLINFIIWMKVATDIFLVLALFLCVGKDEDEEFESSLTEDLPKN